MLCMVSWFNKKIFVALILNNISAVRECTRKLAAVRTCLLTGMHFTARDIKRDWLVVIPSCNPVPRGPAPRGAFLRVTVKIREIRIFSRYPPND